MRFGGIPALTARQGYEGFEGWYHPPFLNRVDGSFLFRHGNLLSTPRGDSRMSIKGVSYTRWLQKADLSVLPQGPDDEDEYCRCM